MTHTSRKRSRACDDDACDFTPISKRINNLHIRSALTTPLDESNEINSTEFARRTFQPFDCISENLHCRLVDRAHNSHHIPMNEAELVGRLMNPNCSCSPLSTSSSSTSRPPLLSPSSSNVVENCDYSPELNAQENPHYYQINRLLFELHINRLQRTGKQ